MTIEKINQIRRDIDKKKTEAAGYEDQGCYNAAYCYGYVDGVEATLKTANAQLSGRDLAKECADAVNSFSFNSKEFAQTICREHKTLQQSWMRVMMTCIEELAKQTNYDLRNEATVMMAKAIVEAVGDKGLPLV